MNTNYIEGLLTDRAMGELPPEMSELLDAYLAEHPEMQPLADEISEAVNLGERALHADLPRHLPVFPKERMLSHSRSTGWNTASRWLSVAASLVIGFSVGISIKLLQNQPLQTDPGTMTSQIQLQPVSDGFETAKAFWSSQIYIERYQKSRKDQIQRNKSTEMQKQIKKFKMRGLL